MRAWGGIRQLRFASAHRALSPSDFGLHNALRTKDGQLRFIDFEYFGWDDPVKLVSDTAIQPGSSLPHSAGPPLDPSGFRGPSKQRDPMFAVRRDVLYPGVRDNLVPDHPE